MSWECTTLQDQIGTAGTAITVALDQADFAGWSLNQSGIVTVTGTDAAPDSFGFVASASLLPPGFSLSAASCLINQSVTITDGAAKQPVTWTVENQDNVVNGLINIYHIWYNQGSSGMPGGYTEVPGVFLTAGQDISAGVSPGFDVTDVIVPQGVYTFTWDDTGCDLTITNQCSAGTLSYAAAGSIDILLENTKVLVSAACYVQARPESYEDLLSSHLWKCPKDGNITSITRGYSAVRFGNGRLDR